MTVCQYIDHTHPAVFSDRLLSIFSNGKVRKEYIADLCISAAVLRIKGFLRFHGYTSKIIFGSIVSVSFGYLYP